MVVGTINNTLQIKIKRNTITFLIDQATGAAFVSLGKNDKMYQYFIEHHADKIREFKPTTL